MWESSLCGPLITLFFFSFYIDWKVNRQKREKIKTKYFTKRVTHPFLSVTKIILKFCSVISSGNTCKAAVWLHISWSYLQPRTSRSPARKPLKDHERGDSLATSMLGNWWRSAQGGKYFLGKQCDHSQYEKLPYFAYPFRYTTRLSFYSQDAQCAQTHLKSSHTYRSLPWTSAPGIPPCLQGCQLYYFLRLDQLQVIRLRLDLIHTSGRG